MQRIYAAGEVIVDNEVYRFHQHTESMEQVVSLGHDPERNAAGYPGYFTVLVASFDDCWQTKYGQMAYGAHWNTSTPLCAGQATSLPQRLRQR